MGEFDTEQSKLGTAHRLDTFSVAAVLTIALAVCVIVLGAYVRLSDAGLACPDWPGCFGKLHAPVTPDETAAAARAFPDWPVDPGKAWLEMAHRYLAAGLGFGVAFLFILALRRKQGAILASGLLLLVVVQALLGMLTVTQRLEPLIVTAHLLGGMSTAGLLLWLYLRDRPMAFRSIHVLPKGVVAVGLAALVIQIGLGGWTSANGAALACEGFPSCLGEWFPSVTLAAAFQSNLSIGSPAADAHALTAIHLIHRLGALVVVAVVGFLIWRLACARAFVLAAGLFAALLHQVALGVGIVLLERPLRVAVMHNANALVLLLLLVSTMYRVSRKGMDSR